MSGNERPSAEGRDGGQAEERPAPKPRVAESNIAAASRGMPGRRDTLPPGSLPEQTPDSQGDQNMEPVPQPGRGTPR